MLVDALDERFLARKMPVDRRICDAHALGEFTRLAVEATLGEEADRLVEDRGGKIAALGSRLVQATSRKLADQFFTAFSERLKG